jgi:hypothetical protein
MQSIWKDVPEDRIHFAFPVLIRNWFILTSAITLLIILEFFVANTRYHYLNTDNILFTDQYEPLRGHTNLLRFITSYIHVVSASHFLLLSRVFVPQNHFFPSVHTDLLITLQA